MALAFMLLLAIVAGGRLWDGISPSAYGPAGLAGGPLREAQLVEADQAARAVITAHLQVPKEKYADLPIADLKEKLREVPVGEDGKRIDAATYARLCQLIDDSQPKQSFAAVSEAFRGALYSGVRSILAGEMRGFFAQFKRAVIEIPVESWSVTPWFTVFFALLCFGVLGVGGGLLCRLQAGDVGDRGWSTSQAWSFISPRARSLFFAPVVAGLLGLVFWVIALLIGVLGAVPLVNIAGGVLFGIALAASFLAVICWLILAVGGALFAPAIACDGCDAIEAVQRSGAYIFARPLHFLAYGLLASVIFLASFVAIDFMACTTWSAATHAFAIAAGSAMGHSAGTLIFLEPFTHPNQLPLGWTDATTGAMLEIWRTILSLLIGACALSVWFGVATRWYLLLRRQSDGQRVDDLWDDAPPAEAA